jgi:hypothetical protein
MKKVFFGSIYIILNIFVFSCSNEKHVEGFSDLRVLADPEGDHITVIFSRDRDLDPCEVVTVSLKQPRGGKKRFIEPEWTVSEEGYALELPLEKKIPWHPDDPALYWLTLKIRDKQNNIFTVGSRRFGIRSLETKNGKFFLNDRPFYVRAYGGEGGCGCDELSKDAIRKRLTQAKAYGFNAVRHHTHIPKDSYMDIADEVGILVQMEIGGNQIGDDVASDRFAEWKDKWIAMIRMARDHPATFIYGCGNEMYGNSPGLIRVLDSLYVLAKTLDPGTLVLNRSGSNPFNDDYGKFDLIERPIGEYEHRAEFAHEAFDAYLRGDRKGRTDEFPVIAHEYPLVASYPNPDLIPKYDSIPSWIDTAIVMAKKNGLEALLPDFVRNTEAIQAQVRKEMLEEARKFPELDGYSMLRFTDCGAYVSGVVDDFSDPKNVPADKFLQTNGETVLLCSWNDRVLTNEDTLRITLHCSHHGGFPFGSRGGEWAILRGGEEEKWRGGEIPGFEVPAVDVKDIATIDILLHDLKKAQKLTLTARAFSGDKTIRNEWEFWVFPDVNKIEAEKTVIWDPNGRFAKLQEIMPGAEYINDLKASKDDLIITDSWDESFYEHMNEGGRIWVMSDKTWPWPEEMGIFGLHITRIDPAYQAPPVFPQLDEPLTNWLTVCSNHPKRYGNSGTMIIDHPALGDFPHDGYCDMQFWPMIYRAKSLRLKDFPGNVQPIIRAIDNFYRCESKGYLVDLQVGKGRLLISTLNLLQHLETSASTRYMTKQLYNYIKSDQSAPGSLIRTDELRQMLTTYAEEVRNNPPRVHSEMAARYETLWERRLSPGDVIVLYPYEADGISKNKLDIHYEYAQTQWYYKAVPGDELTWTFENDASGEYELHLNLAGVHTSNKIKLEIEDQGLSLELAPECSGSWQSFVETVIPVKDLKPGEHTLRIKIPEDVDVDNHIAFLIRDLQVKEIMKKEEY